MCGPSSIAGSASRTGVIVGARACARYSASVSSSDQVVRRDRKGEGAAQLVRVEARPRIRMRRELRHSAPAVHEIFHVSRTPSACGGSSHLREVRGRRIRRIDPAAIHEHRESAALGMQRRENLHAGRAVVRAAAQHDLMIEVVAAPSRARGANARPRCPAGAATAAAAAVCSRAASAALRARRSARRCSCHTPSRAKISGRDDREHGGEHVASSSCAKR